MVLPSEELKDGLSFLAYVEQYFRGELKVDEFISFTMPLEEINRAFDLMHEGKSIRSVIHF